MERSWSFQRFGKVVNISICVFFFSTRLYGKLFLEGERGGAPRGGVFSVRIGTYLDFFDENDTNCKFSLCYSASASKITLIYQFSEKSASIGARTKSFCQIFVVLYIGSI
jgi:hypothetical protein